MEVGSVPPLLLYAIPVFFLLIFVEVIACAILRRTDYRLNDSINDLSMRKNERRLLFPAPLAPTNTLRFFSSNPSNSRMDLNPRIVKVSSWLCISPILRGYS